MQWHTIWWHTVHTIWWHTGHTIWWHIPRGNYNYLLKKNNMRKTIWKPAPQTCSTFVSRMIDICNVSESSHRSNFPTVQNTWASRLFVWGSCCSLFSLSFLLLVIPLVSFLNESLMSRPTLLLYMYIPTGFEAWSASSGFSLVIHVFTCRHIVVNEVWALSVVMHS